MAGNRKISNYIKGKRLSERAAFIMEFLWQNFVSVDFSVTSGVKYGTIHISVGLSLQIPEGIRFYIRFSKNVIPVGMRKQ